jgi:hypothetical protein
LLTAGIVAAIASGSGGSSSKSAATSSSSTSSTLSPRQTTEQRRTQDWQGQVDSDYQPLTNDLIQLLQQIQNWRDGKAPSSQLTALIDHYLPDFLDTRDKLLHQAAYPAAPTSIDSYRTALQVYLEALRDERVATTLPAGALQTQLDWTFRRLRELGDRIYDQGRAVLKPSLHEAPPSPDVQTRLPADVPNWVAEGMAAGRPLDSTPPPAAKTPPEFQQKRPQQSYSSWARAVRGAGVPPAAQLASAINGADGGALQQLADRYAAATATLDGKADPSGDRALSTRVRLGLLVDGESARVAQASTLVTDPTGSARLKVVAQRLALIGDGLWPSSLGTRQSGFDPGLLNQGGP